MIPAWTSKVVAFTGWLFLVAPYIAALAPNAAPLQSQKPPQQAAPHPTLGSLDDDLKRALTKYLTAQTRIESPVNPLAVWFQPTFVAALLGALLGASANLLVSELKRRTDITRNQELNFLEALKRLGDKDSSQTRLSGVNLLVELALKKRKSTPEPSAYFESVVEQLVAASTLEGNTWVSRRIRSSLNRLVLLRRPDQGALHSSNLDLQHALAEALAAFFSVRGARAEAGISVEMWADASRLSGYSEAILRTLVERMRVAGTTFDLTQGHGFPEMLRFAAHEASDSTSPRADELERALTASGYRLRNNVQLWVSTLHAGHQITGEVRNLFLSGATIFEANLANAYLAGLQMQESKLGTHVSLAGANLLFARLDGSSFLWCDLSEAVLRQASLRGATLLRTKLDDAKLFGAKLEAAASIDSTEWWKADFAYEDEVDQICLDSLFRRFEEVLDTVKHFSSLLETQPNYATTWRIGRESAIASIFPDAATASAWPEGVHPSVRQYLLKSKPHLLHPF